MTVSIDLTNVLIALITCLISVLATWFFSRRHYTGASRRQTVSDNEITLQEKQNEFRLNVILVVVLLLSLMVLMGSATYCYQITRETITDVERTPNATETMAPRQTTSPAPSEKAPRP